VKITAAESFAAKVGNFLAGAEFHRKSKRIK